MSTVVTTQSELDAALKSCEPYGTIHIQSPAGVWLEVSNTGTCDVSAYDSASVRAYGSASVRASGSASVRASGSASVSASGSASVSAYGSASVSAFDSASVSAFGSASVSASGSASVSAFDSASVSAGKYVAVHLHSKSVRLDGGVLIDMTDVDQQDTATWIDLTGATVEGGKVLVYKAVDKDLCSGRGFAYPIGETLTDPAWTDDHQCGGGLHFSPSPGHALDYFREATRFLACLVDVDAVRCIDSTKLKAPSCTVLYEVDLVTAKPLTAEVS